MKTCSRCSESKPLAEFHNHKGRSDGRASHCKDCHKVSMRAAQAKWRAKNTTDYKASQVRHKLKRAYGITPCDFTRQLIAQQGCCAVCGRDEPGGKGTWHVDHDHATGLLRGLLCHNCNLALGHAKDSIETLQRAATYLAAGGVWNG